MSLKTYFAKKIGGKKIAGCLTGKLEDLIRRVACFGLTMVRLDIRQNAERF